MMTDGECEPLGHNANDRGRGAVEVNGAAHEVRVRVEAAAPLVVSDDDHRRRVWTFIFVVQRSRPSNSRNSHQAEAGGSDRGDTHQVGRRGDQIATVLTKRADSVTDLSADPPRSRKSSRGQAGPPAGVRAGDRSGLDRHRAIAIVHRQRRIQHGAEDAEVGRANRGIASARPVTATADSPGYLASIRIPSFRSSQDTFTKILRSSAARRRAERCRPCRTTRDAANRSIAASRATCGLIP